MKIAHVEAGNVVPPIVGPQPEENVSGKAAGNAPRATYLGTFLKKMVKDFGNFFKV